MRSTSSPGEPQPYQRHRVAPTRVVVVGPFPPHRCGIAGFTEGLVGALARAAPDLRPAVCAVDRDGSEYGGNVAFTLARNCFDDYAAAAARIAAVAPDLVLLQYGDDVYGGPDGAWVAGFAEGLTRHGTPYAVLLHSGLVSASPTRVDLLRELCQAAGSVAVFAPEAAAAAAEAGLAPRERIVVVPYGAPPVLGRAAHIPASGLRPEVARALADLRGGPVVGTFGPGASAEGLDTAFAAVSRLTRRHPRLRYAVAARAGRAPGEKTVPGENTVPVHEELTVPETAVLLGHTDVFLAPHRSRDEAGSGMLACALAAGCPVVSVPSAYARHMLAGGAGTVVPDDPAALAAALDGLLSDPARIDSAAAAAREAGNSLVWPEAARHYALMIRAAARSARRPRPGAAQAARP